MDAKSKPRSLEIIGEQVLAVVWEDAHESVYEGRRLRENCPCADCRTKRMRAAQASAPPKGGLALAMAPPRLVGMEQVGRYAVRLHWSDRHSAGLYDFGFLRSLCPCEVCAANL